MTALTTQRLFAHQALLRKKSWLLVAAMVGHVPDDRDFWIPDYSIWTKAKLRAYIADLEDGLLEALGRILKHPRQGLRPSALAWFANHFDQWQRQGYGLLSLSTAFEFESRIGELRARSELDIPPYAELLIQPGFVVAFRHPEYHLASDLKFLCDLYGATEHLLKTVDWSSRPDWAPTASENNLALGRTIILTCFNLLESFVSGLARAHTMLHPELGESVTAKLLDTSDPLRKRIVSVPRQILGREPPFDLNEPPLSVMFGVVKQYRDSFVHCEPGGQPSRLGYVKEQLFHDVTPGLVDEAVSNTESVIRLVWRAVYGIEGPRWLRPHESIYSSRNGDRLVYLKHIFG